MTCRCVAPSAAEEVVEHHGGRDDFRRGRDRQSDEVPLLDIADLHVEARQTQRTTSNVEGGSQPAERSPWLECPAETSTPGATPNATKSHSESYWIPNCEVVFVTRATRPSNASNTFARHDRDRGDQKLAAQRWHDGVKAAEEAGRGDQVR